jgi:acetamidase/formamidase
LASTHTVESTPETVRSGYLDPAAAPVAVIGPGDTVRYPHTWTHWGNEAKFGMSFADREPLRHRYPNGPYSMLGPVRVSGAEPGDVVECSITNLRTIGWSWNSFPLGVGALPHDFAEPYVHYFTFDEARTTAEFTHGIKLPSGARIWTGDVHALQGDGVVDQTAIETAAEDLTIRYDLHKDVALRGPLGETRSTWIVIGFGANLDDALVACLRETIHWLATAAQIAESEAYALASMAVSFRVTQYANQTGSAYSSIPAKAVHAVLPKAVFPAGIQDRIGAWLRPPQAAA